MNHLLATMAFMGSAIGNLLPSTHNTEFKVPKSPNQAEIISLGEALDNESGKKVEGFAIIRRKEGRAKPSGGGGRPQTACYAFMAKGAKWKKIENWQINPANIDNVDQSQIFDSITSNIQTWENAAGRDIVGNGSMVSNNLVADTLAPDNQNEVYFASIDDPGVIGVTIVWGIFSGPTASRELVEWDQVYDDVDFDWSLTTVLGKMNFANIATHELGHALGMADLYTTECSQETMYGYASEGEDNKITLNSGDVVGIRTLYQ